MVRTLWLAGLTLLVSPVATAGSADFGLLSEGAAGGAFPAVGEAHRFVATDVFPGVTVWFVISVAEDGEDVCPAALQGRCLDIAGPASLLGSAVSDASGRATLDVVVPSAFAADRQVSVQAVALAGRPRLSNAVVTRSIDRDADSDGDTVLDGDEVAQGTSPFVADSDLDGCSDGQDAAPLIASTDEDGDGAGADCDACPLDATTLTAPCAPDGLAPFSLCATSSPNIAVATGTVPCEQFREDERWDLYALQVFEGDCIQVTADNGSGAGDLLAFLSDPSGPFVGYELDRSELDDERACAVAPSTGGGCPDLAFEVLSTGLAIIGVTQHPGTCTGSVSYELFVQQNGFAVPVTSAGDNVQLNAI